MEHVRFEDPGFSEVVLVQRQFHRENLAGTRVSSLEPTEHGTIELMSPRTLIRPSRSADALSISPLVSAEASAKVSCTDRVGRQMVARFDASALGADRERDRVGPLLGASGNSITTRTAGASRSKGTGSAFSSDSLSSWNHSVERKSATY